MHLQPKGASEMIRPDYSADTQEYTGPRGDSKGERVPVFFDQMVFRKFIFQLQSFSGQKIFNRRLSPRLKFFNRDQVDRPDTQRQSMKKIVGCTPEL